MMMPPRPATGGLMRKKLFTIGGYRFTVGMLLMILAVVGVAAGVYMKFVSSDYSRRRRIAAMRRRIAATKRYPRRKRLYGKTAA